MLHQNWFMDKKFEMFEEYAESQSFYDTETKNIYVVSEEYGQEGSTIIQEITPESFEYQANISRYNEMKNSHNLTKQHSELQTEVEKLNARIELLQKALLQTLKENNQQDVKVSRKDFLEMYDFELNHMFELSEKNEKDFTKENQKIYEHNVTVHWNGIYCDCGDGAAPSNHIIPGIKTCDEEWEGEEWE